VWDSRTNVGRRPTLPTANDRLRIGGCVEMPMRVGQWVLPSQREHPPADTCEGKGSIHPRPLARAVQARMRHR